ncbi:MAG: STM4015 family protein [Pseudomonadota bacterium]|nr:STM4015 family protein [Pseudomonadota bacterium]
MQSSVRRFEMVEGSASKFWEVGQDGASFTVVYGRIGTAGQSKTTACASPEAARAEVDKLVREKTKKGYQELGVAEKNWRPPAHVDTGSHIERFLNYKVAGFNPDADPEDVDEESGRREFPTLRDLDKRVFRVGIQSYEDAEEDFATRLDALLADKRVGELRGLVIGGWFSEVCEAGPTVLCERLIANASKLRALRGLFVGDIIQEECEISWLHQSDYAPVLRALPQLEELVVRGGEGLRFEGLAHPNLRSLTVQTGGLSGATVRDIVAADLPELRVLTLWLGTDDYGGDATVADFAPLLAGDRFPKLEHLGLQDSENADDIAVAIAKSPLLARLSGLDLSMGTLSDIGGQALLDSPHLRGLKHLNLRYHYLSADMVKKIRALGIEVNAGDRQEGDEDDRYVEVSE